MSPLRFCLPWLGLLAGLPACSPAADSPTAPPATAAAPRPDTPSPTPASLVDSLGGLPGHRFGKPLSAFLGLERVPTNPGGFAVYGYPSGSTRDKSWFGRHPQQARGLVYYFVEGKFAGLSTYADRPGTALLLQAQYLLGPGTGQGDERDWTGEHVVATWRPAQFGTGQFSQQLRILSKPLLARQQQLDRQRQQAENQP